jgi:hypothetical protein
MKTDQSKMARFAAMISRRKALLLTASASCLPLAVPGIAQEGSPDGTTTIDGNQLPPPPPKFEETAKDSKPWWPPAWSRPRVRPIFCSS